jgi:hypothetical protein
MTCSPYFMASTKKEIWPQSRSTVLTVARKLMNPKLDGSFSASAAAHAAG